MIFGEYRILLSAKMLHSNEENEKTRSSEERAQDTYSAGHRKALDRRGMGYRI